MIDLVLSILRNGASKINPASVEVGSTSDIIEISEIEECDDPRFNPWAPRPYGQDQMRGGRSPREEKIVVYCGFTLLHEPLKRVYLVPSHSGDED